MGPFRVCITMGSTPRCRAVAAILASAACLGSGPRLAADERLQGPIRLSTGREVHLVEGRIRPDDARAVYREAGDLLRAGRVDQVYEAARLLIARGDSAVADEGRRLLASAEAIDFSSVVVLRNGGQITGRIRSPLRSDRLGLEGKVEIPLWTVERIDAEYLVNYSAVSKTFYPYTLVEVTFRAGSSASGRLADESELILERRDGSLARLLLGLPFELLRQDQLAEWVERQSRGRVARVLVYAGLATLTPPSEGSGR
jgi:hypothetical protein